MLLTRTRAALGVNHEGGLFGGGNRFTWSEYDNDT